MLSSDNFIISSIIFAHHQCNGHELEQTLGDSEGQGGLVCCSPWGHKELETTGQLNNSSIIFGSLILFEFTFVYGISYCSSFNLYM